MPKHIWIIMDWNRRWAKQRLLPSIAWHKAWADNVKKIVNHSITKWITHITMWALYKDNLKKRDKKEVEWIIKLINNIESFLWDMFADNVRFETIWNIEELPLESQKILNNVKEKTKGNTWITLILALIYWWQDEIIRATKKIIKSGMNPDNLSSEEYRKFTDTGKFPIVDLIIRTWWDIRHSWFMLFDSEYSEYYFTDKKWPEFNYIELDKAIDSFKWSKRNFWK